MKKLLSQNFTLSYKIVSIIFIFSLFMISCSDDEIVTPIVDDAVHSAAIRQDETWCADKIHYVEGAISIRDAVLTICEGAIVKFKQGAGIVISTNAGLIVGGDTFESLPVLMTGEESTPGFWDILDFRSDAREATSRFNNTTIEYGGSRGSMILVSNDVVFRRSVIKSSGSTGLKVMKPGVPTLDSVLISLCGGVPIESQFSNTSFITPSTSFLGNTLSYVNLLTTGGYITQDVTWNLIPIPYKINGNVNIIESGTLTIEAGNNILMGDNVRVIIEDLGGLKAIGTQSDPITFSGSTPQPGFWDTFEFRDDANHADCIFDNCVIEHGGNSYYMIRCAGSNLTIQNSIIRNSGTVGVIFDQNSNPTFSNNTVTGCLDAPIIAAFNNVGNITGGSYTGNTNDYIRVTGGKIITATNFEDLDVPYRLVGTINYITTSTLTVESGTTIELDDGVRILIEEDGGLMANGSAGEILFTGATKTKGFWNTIEIRADANSGSCVFDGCKFEYGGSIQGTFELRGCSPTIKNSTIQFSGACGIYKNKPANPTMINNTYFNNVGDDVCEY
jgi:hypothetical protein